MYKVWAKSGQSSGRVQAKFGQSLGKVQARGQGQRPGGRGQGRYEYMVLGWGDYMGGV